MSECMIFYGPIVPEINYSILFYKTKHLRSLYTTEIRCSAETWRLSKPIQHKLAERMGNIFKIIGYVRDRKTNRSIERHSEAARTNIEM